MYAPASTPANVAERLRTAILDALGNAEIRVRIETLGFEVAGTTGEELARIQRADYERWGPIIKASGFKADQ
jgi:tripartite-type tricarboxylate transporter receptor subunit TctC